jgi:hypothetical protein
MRLAATAAVAFVLVQAGLQAAQPVTRTGHDPYAASHHVPYGSQEASYEGAPDAPFVGSHDQDWVHPCCKCPSCKLMHGLPHPHKSRCDMPLHIPYLAEPKFYYYFRPYQWFHIPVQQGDVQAFGGDPRHPYDNRIFQSVYQNLHFDTPAPEQVAPPTTPEAPPAGARRATPARTTAAPSQTGSPKASESSSSVRIRRVSTQSQK